MAANQRIDQPLGAGAGVSGNARTSLWLNRQVELHDTGTGMSRVRSWTLNYKPAGSAAAITSSTASPALITPDVYGTYMITLQYDGDAITPTKSKTFVFRVDKTNAGVAVAGLVINPAFREKEAHSQGISGQGSTGGWTPLEEALYSAVSAFAAVSAPDALEFGGVDKLSVDATTITGHVGLVNFPAAVAAVAITHAQDASAAGGSFSITAQQGFAGFVGGDINFSTGRGGTPATNAAGNFNIDLGRQVGITGAKFALRDELAAGGGARDIFTVRSIGAGVSVDAGVTGSMSVTGGQFVFTAGVSNIVFISTTGIDFRSGDRTYAWSGAGVRARTDTMHGTGATTLVWSDAVASVDETWNQHLTAAGNHWTFKGQKGAAGFVGGNVVIRSGEGGTLGTNRGGNLVFGVGQSDATRTGIFSLEGTPGTQMLSIGRTAGGIVYITSGTSAPGTGGTDFLIIDAIQMNLQANNALAISGQNGPVSVFANGIFGVRSATRQWSNVASGEINKQEKDATVTMATAATDNIMTFTASANRAYKLRVVVMVSNNADNASSNFEKGASFEHGGGALTQNGATFAITPDVVAAGDAGLTVTVDNSGNDIRVRWTRPDGDSRTATATLELWEIPIA